MAIFSYLKEIFLQMLLWFNQVKEHNLGNLQQPLMAFVGKIIPFSTNVDPVDLQINLGNLKQPLMAFTSTCN